MIRMSGRSLFAVSVLSILGLLAGITLPAQAMQGWQPMPVGIKEPENSTPECQAPHLALISEPNISTESSVVTGRSEFDWWWKSTGGFEAQSRAFAGDIGVLNCILNPDCTILDVLKDLILASSESYGDTKINDIALRLEGPAGAKAIVRASGDVDGLLLGAAVGVAEARSKVVSNLQIQYPGGTGQLVAVDRTEYAYLLEQFSEHISGAGSGSGSLTFVMDTANEIHLTGGIRAEANSISTASGVSAGVSFFQNVYPTDEVQEPGLTILVEIVDTIPVLGTAQPVVGAEEGQIVQNEGWFCDGDGDDLALSASSGTVINNHNGTWSWRTTTKNGPRESRLITISADDGRGGVGQTSFELVVENVPPVVDAGPDQKVFRDETVMLTGSWMDPAGGEDNPYLWTWDTTGDGVGDTSQYGYYGEIANVQARFSAPGIYELTLTVRDRDGEWGSDSVQIEVVNRPPTCKEAYPGQERLWPPDHRWVPVEVLGISDPDGDPLEVTILSIFQDEPVIGWGSGFFSPDGRGVGTEGAEVRAERSAIFNGRVYHIRFEARDSFGEKCTGKIRISVPLSKKKSAVDNGAVFDSTKFIRFH